MTVTSVDCLLGNLLRVVWMGSNYELVCGTALANLMAPFPPFCVRSIMTQRITDALSMCPTDRILGLEDKNVAFFINGAKIFLCRINYDRLTEQGKIDAGQAKNALLKFETSVTRLIEGLQGLIVDGQQGLHH